MQVKHTDSDTDGEEFVFETQTSTVETSRSERLRDFYEEFIYKPGLVALDDSRTLIGGVILFVFILIALVGTRVYPAPVTNQVERSLKPFETMNAPLGSNPSGTDLLAQVIHATPSMLILVTAGAVFSTFVAVFTGTVAGYKGGTTDRVITTISDIAMSIPGLPLVMVLAVTIKPENPAVVGILLTINYWSGLGRAIRSQVLTLREESYVEASRTMGVSTRRILTKDIIPNLMPYILVNFAFAARYCIFAGVGLYYLGVLPADLANWGLQLDSAYNDYSALVGSGSEYLVIVPMIPIALLSLSLVLLAQGLDRIFNPRVRTRMAGESESIEEEDDDVVHTGGV
ncbi:ABC transporter permease subunit [Halomicrobium mukohataei]|uniref:ABC transporter permease subunit n=1 Tax=Halomicrobium mukohataei TaxID=57705 RepID=A0A847TU02_9EURY|nr:ABC transporter permease [Halomicrobium mukohataei]NLV09522.1 ABC transporter permease subunit [Halomicrobium mukohataei]